MNIQKEHQKLDAKSFRSLLAYVHVLTTRTLFPNALTKNFAMCLSCCFLLSGFLKILGIHSFQLEVASSMDTSVKRSMISFGASWSS